MSARDRKTPEVVVYRTSAPCRNSGVAAQRLIELSYTNVREYHDGKADWIEPGLSPQSVVEPARPPPVASASPAAKKMNR